MDVNKRTFRPPVLFLVVIWFFQIYTSSGQIPPKVKLGLKDFLMEYLLMDNLPVYQTNTYCAQVSSYDTTGGNDDGFSGKYSQWYRNPDSSLTLFEMQGPGVIQRIWTPTPSEDSLNFFIDDRIVPAFTIRYRDLFSGQVYPFIDPLCDNQLGGYFCYLPIPFNRYCKIIYKGKKTQFHQIQYRVFPVGYEIQSFNIVFKTEERKLLEAIRKLWSDHSYSPGEFYSSPLMQTREVNKSLTLIPGQQINLFNALQGGRILAIELGPQAAFEGLDKNVDIQLTWDDETQPAVYCPVSDFFGYAFGKPSMKSLLLGSRGQNNYCYFPMPFDRKARIDLIYRKQAGSRLTPLTIHSKITYQNKPRDQSWEGKFYARWTGQYTSVNQPHTFLDIRAKGHYVGTILQAQGLKPGMTLFFEGDDSTAIDGQHRMHGTGSEDYFNGGWYALLDRWDGAYSLPLSGSLDYSLAFCRTGGYRLFLGDKISFEKSFYHSIEHGPVGNGFPGIYTSVSFYYADRAPDSTLKPESAETRVYQPDTMILYPQLLSFSMEGDIHSVTKWAYPTGGETYYFTVSPGTILRTSLAEIPEGDYELSIDFIQSPESCDFTLWQRQTPLTGPIHGFLDQTRRVEHQKLTRIHIDRLNPTISFQFKPEPGKNKFILNRLILTKVRS